MGLAADRLRLNATKEDRHGDALMVVERGTTIPKIIHQTNHARPWPRLTEDNVSRLRHMNRDWAYRFYSNAEQRSYVGDMFGPQMLAYFDRIDASYAAARADFFRYLLMYKEGGIYLDIKSGTQRPLSETIDPSWQYLLSTWPNRQGGQYDLWGLHDELTRVGLEEYQQWHIICAPGHPFLRAVILATMRNIRTYNPFLHGTARKAVLNITGPIAYTLAIAPLIGSESHVRRSVADLGIYYSVYDLEGHGNEAHVGASHYSRLIGRPVITSGAIMTTAYRTVRKIAGK